MLSLLTVPNAFWSSHVDDEWERKKTDQQLMIAALSTGGKRQGETVSLECGSD